MKILLVNTIDTYGGAARACYRLHQSLQEQGVNSTLLVQNKFSKDDSVIGPKNFISKFISRIRHHIDQFPLKFHRKKQNGFFSSNIFQFNRLSKKINKLKPDIVHLHWTCSGFLDINDLKNIKAPIVFSLHDMWLFTGGCHYNNSCEKFKKTCGSCINLGSSSANDLSRKSYLKKAKAFSSINRLTVVALSQWLKNSASSSSLLKDQKIINLPNPINTSIFKPIRTVSTRNTFKLPLNKKLVLFGAMSATSDPRKGFNELTKAISKIKDSSIMFLIFGSDTVPDILNSKDNIIALGNISNDQDLIELYNAVNLVVTPSLQENLSNTIMESLSCGTPVAAFNIGGNIDMIDHKNNGYLAKPFDTDDLAQGIEWALETNNQKKLSQNARNKAMNCFDSKLVSSKYMELYQDILKNTSHNSISN